MNDRIRFSVIVPVYNAEKYLQATINSVLNQTYDNFELILVNDGSTDASGEICRRNSEEHPERIVLIEQANSGPFEARKNGIRHAQGTHVVFLDADDLLAIAALETIGSELVQQDSDVLAYRGCRNGEFVEDAVSSFFSIDGESDNENVLDEAREKLLQTDRINNLWLKCVKMECLREYAASAAQDLLMAEDKLACAYILDVAQSYRQIDAILYYYRANQGGTTKSAYTQKRLDDLFVVYAELLHYAKTWHLECDIPRLQALLLAQACTEISALYESATASPEVEAMHIRHRFSLMHIMNEQSMQLLKPHRRLLIKLFMKNALILKAFLPIYRRGVALAQKERA